MKIEVFKEEFFSIDLVSSSDFNKEIYRDEYIVVYSYGDSIKFRTRIDSGFKLDMSRIFTLEQIKEQEEYKLLFINTDYDYCSFQYYKDLVFIKYESSVEYEIKTKGPIKYLYFEGDLSISILNVYPVLLDKPLDLNIFEALQEIVHLGIVPNGYIDVYVFDSDINLYRKAKFLLMLNTMFMDENKYINLEVIKPYPYLIDIWNEIGTQVELSFSYDKDIAELYILQNITKAFPIKDCPFKFELIRPEDPECNLYTMVMD